MPERWAIRCSTVTASSINGRSLPSTARAVVSSVRSPRSTRAITVSAVSPFTPLAIANRVSTALDTPCRRSARPYPAAILVPDRSSIRTAPENPVRCVSSSSDAARSSMPGPYGRSHRRRRGLPLGAEKSVPRLSGLTVAELLCRVPCGVVDRHRDDGRAVGTDLGPGVAEVGGVETHPDAGVPAARLCRVEQPVHRLVAAFGQLLGHPAELSAEDRLEPGAHLGERVAGADGQSKDLATDPLNLPSGDLVRRDHQHDASSRVEDVALTLLNVSEYVVGDRGSAGPTTRSVAVPHVLMALPPDAREHPPECVHTRTSG